MQNELVTRFEFEGNLNPLNQYNLQFGDAISLMTKSIGIVTAVGGALLGLSNSTLQVVDDLGQLSRTTNTSVEWLQEMGYSASVSGSSVEALQRSVEGLSSKIGEAAINGSSEFDKIGISVRNANGQVKSTNQVFGELSSRFKNLSAAERVSFAEKLGIDKSLIQLLTTNNEQLTKTREIAKSFGVVSSAQADKVMEFNDSLTTLKFGLNAVGQQISLGFMPQMTELSGSFIDLLLTNKDLIKNGLTKFIEISGGVLQALWNTGKAVYTLIDDTVGIKPALAIATGAVLLFNKALLANPIVLTAAAIVGMILAVDDLVVAFEGGNSVIADFFKAFNIDIVSLLTADFNILKGVIKGAYGLILGIGEAFLSLVTTITGFGASLGLDLGINDTAMNALKSLREEGNRVRQESKDLITKGFSTDIRVNQNLPIGTNSTNQAISNKQTNNITNNINTTSQVPVNDLAESLNNSLTSANEQFRQRGR